MICPQCRERYRWYETTCPNCQVTLVDRVEGVPEPDPETELVSVFRTTDSGLLPLAEMTLRDEHIEYAVRRLSNDVRRSYSVAVTDYNNPLDAAEVVVASADAARARDLLVDLENPSMARTAGDATGTGAASEDGAAIASEPAGVSRTLVTDAETGVRIGFITDVQLQTLLDLLEEESDTSHDYYIDLPTIEMLEGANADPALIELLRGALGPRPDVTIRWSR
jgi:hypothetical protein